MRSGPTQSRVMSMGSSEAMGSHRLRGVVIVDDTVHHTVHDPTPEEFESFDFNREKIIAGGSQAVIFVGPLKPGRYNFFGEFNMETAQGYLVVK